MKKKHVLAPASFAIVLALAGCGSSGSADTADAAPADSASGQASASTPEAAASYEFPEASCKPSDEDSKKSTLPFDQWTTSETDFGHISCEGVDLAKLSQVKNGGETYNVVLRDIPEPEEIVDMSGLKFDAQSLGGVDLAGHIGAKAASSLATLDVASLNLGDDGVDMDLSAFKDNDFDLVMAKEFPMDMNGFGAIPAKNKQIGLVGGGVKGEDVPSDLPEDIIVTVDATSKGADKARAAVGVNTYEKIVLKANDKGTIELAELPDLDWQPAEYGAPDWLAGNTMDIAKYRETSDGMGLASMEADIKVDGKQKKVTHTIMVSEQ